MKVLCVGSNYAHHAREMGGTTPKEPIWFWKPTSAIIGDGDAIVVPPGIGAVHHEVELAFRVGRRVHRETDEAAALAAIDAVTIAIDVTARDLQNEAKESGKPWAMAKGFDTFLPLGPWVSTWGDLGRLRLVLRVNEAIRQEGSTGDMTWAPGALLVAASQWTTLEPGDIILTGTPEGVGPIVPGDRVEAELWADDLLAHTSHPVA